MFEILRAGNGAWFTVASKNEILEGTRKAAIEAIRSRPSPSRGPRFAQKNSSLARRGWRVRLLKFCVMVVWNWSVAGTSGCLSQGRGRGRWRGSSALRKWISNCPIRRSSHCALSAWKYRDQGTVPSCWGLQVLDTRERGSSSKNGTTKIFNHRRYRWPKTLSHAIARENLGAVYATWPEKGAAHVIITGAMVTQNVTQANVEWWKTPSWSGTGWGSMPPIRKYTSGGIPWVQRQPRT